jgi:acetylglutamate synthase
VAGASLVAIQLCDGDLNASVENLQTGLEPAFLGLTAVVIRTLHILGVLMCVVFPRDPLHQAIKKEYLELVPESADAQAAKDSVIIWKDKVSTLYSTDASNGSTPQLKNVSSRSK